MSDSSATPRGEGAQFIKQIQHAEMFFYSSVFVFLIFLLTAIISLRTGYMIFLDILFGVIFIALNGAAFYLGLRGVK